MRYRSVVVTRLGLGILALAGWLMTGNSARAACGFTPGGHAMPLLPMLGQAGADWHEHGENIVGLWHVTYTAGGKVFNETLKEWHSDFTEFENAWLPPAAGNVCFGVWKETSHREVKLHHMGWTFDGTGKTTANGIFVIDEDDKLSEDGKTYSGSFTFTPYTIAGAKGTAVAGTVAAIRITVD
jgi:hypothetical protein